MDPRFYLVLPYFLVAAFILGVGLFSFFSNLTRTAWSMGLFCFSASQWALWNGFLYLGLSPETNILIIKIKLLCSEFNLIFVGMLILDLFGYGSWVTWPRLAAAVGAAVFFITCGWLYPRVDWLWKDIYTVENFVDLPGWSPGILYYVMLGYIYLLGTSICLVATVNLFSSNRQARRLAQISVPPLLIVFGLHFLFNSGLGPLPGVDFTPLGFGPTGVALAWALIGYGVLDIMPVAKTEAFNHLPTGLIVVNGRNKILDLNPAAGLFLEGTGLGARVGRRQIIRDDIFGGLGAGNSEPARRELKIGENCYELQTIPLLKLQRELLGRLLVVRDITAQKKYEEKLKEDKDAAQKQAEDKGRFLAHISHEIRGPSNAIVTVTDFLLNLTHEELQRRYIRSIRSSVDLLSAMINNMLDLARVEAGKLKLFENIFNLENDLAQVMESLSVRAELRQLKLTSYLAPDVPGELIGDSMRVRQVMYNLIGNAIKFTDEGEVRVEITVEDALTEAVLVLFSIRDTGPGITLEDRKHLFEPYQVSEQGRQGAESVGLGLNISRLLVEMMGGRIWYGPGPEGGSIFYFNVLFRRPPENRGTPSGGRGRHL